MFSESSNIPKFIQISLVLLIMLFISLSTYYLIYIGNKNLSAEKQLNFSWKKLSKFILVVILIAVFSYFLNNYPIIKRTLFAFFISVIIGFIINPLVNKLETYKIKRNIGTIIVYISIILFFVLIGFLVIPSIVSQLKNFVKNLPQNIAFTLEYINDTLERFNINSKVISQLNIDLKSQVNVISKNIVSWSSSIYDSLYGSFSIIFTTILIPIITFYLVVDKEKILDKLFNLIPKKNKNDFMYLYSEINESMGHIVRGRIIMAIFVGVVTGFILMLMGIDFALVIGLITMVADIIPYVGPLMGFVPALIFAFISSPIKAVWVGLLFLFIQWIENNILGPKILGDSTGLHPLVILISIIIGGGMFGVWGMILSVPFVSIVMIFYEFIKLKLYSKVPNVTD